MAGTSTEVFLPERVRVELNELAENIASSSDGPGSGEHASAPIASATKLTFRECQPSGSNGLFALLDPGCASEYREQFRLLRSHLLLRRTRMEAEREFKIVAVMSPQRRDGKSFTASNLAAVLALSSGQRVLLIDANSEGEPLPIGSPVGEGGGLRYALAAPQNWAQATHRVKSTSLHVMARGGSGAAPGLDFEPLPQLLETVRDYFDWIVLDGLAFASAPDAPWISAISDGTLVVVRQDASSFGEVEESLASVSRDRLVGIVFNERKQQNALRLRIRSARR